MRSCTALMTSCLYARHFLKSITLTRVVFRVRACAEESASWKHWAWTACLSSYTACCTYSEKIRVKCLCFSNTLIHLKTNTQLCPARTHSNVTWPYIYSSMTEHSIKKTHSSCCGEFGTLHLGSPICLPACIEPE